MYINNELVDSVEVLPLPFDRRYIQDMLRKLWLKHEANPELEQASFLIEGVSSGVHSSRQYTQKQKNYLSKTRSRVKKHRKRPGLSTDSA